MIADKARPAIQAALMSMFVAGLARMRFHRAGGASRPFAPL
jgi:hypothetical protein